jgi:hypothetical protein
MQNGTYGSRRLVVAGGAARVDIGRARRGELCDRARQSRQWVLPVTPAALTFL